MAMLKFFYSERGQSIKQVWKMILNFLLFITARQECT